MKTEFNKGWKFKGSDGIWKDVTLPHDAMQEDLKLHPDRLILGSKTFPQDLSGNWEMVEELPNLVGDFMWTAWDYLGEAGLGGIGKDHGARGSFERGMRNSD